VLKEVEGVQLMVAAKVQMHVWMELVGQVYFVPRRDEEQLVLWVDLT